jgi:hypothetical protein
MIIGSIDCEDFFAALFDAVISFKKNQENKIFDHRNPAIR